MNGYQLPGIKLLNRIYKNENKRNGGLGVVFFYNNYLVKNTKSQRIILDYVAPVNAGIPDTNLNLYYSVAQQPVSVAQQPVSVAIFTQ